MKLSDYEYKHLAVRSKYYKFVCFTGVYILDELVDGELEIQWLDAMSKGLYSKRHGSNAIGFMENYFVITENIYLERDKEILMDMRDGII